jgi:uncharacterized membrane protein
MIKQLLHNFKKHNRLIMITLMGCSMLVSLFLLAVRMHYTSTIGYRFLIWNLFLAAVPYGISTFLMVTGRRMPKSMLFFFLMFWLAFLPNAPYILTDLLHLRNTHQAILWYDLMLILSFAWNGLMLAYLSLLDVHEILRKRFSVRFSWFVTIFSLVAASFGIYLGRFLRWNSWDIWNNPTSLLYDVAHRVVYPMDHPRTYAVTMFFSVFLILGFLTIKQLSKMKLR